MKADALNLTLMVDQKLAYLMETFAPFYNSKQLDNVGRVSGNIYISKSLVGSLGQYLESEEE